MGKPFLSNGGGGGGGHQVVTTVTVDRTVRLRIISYGGVGQVSSSNAV
jgi:hypothetical protein